MNGKTWNWIIRMTRRYLLTSPNLNCTVVVAVDWREGMFLGVLYRNNLRQFSANVCKVIFAKSNGWCLCTHCGGFPRAIGPLGFRLCGTVCLWMFISLTPWAVDYRDFSFMWICFRLFDSWSLVSCTSIWVCRLCIAHRRLLVWSRVWWRWECWRTKTCVETYSEMCLFCFLCFTFVFSTVLLRVPGLSGTRYTKPVCRIPIVLNFFFWTLDTFRPRNISHVSFLRDFEKSNSTISFQHFVTLFILAGDTSEPPVTHTYCSHHSRLSVELSVTENHFLNN